jgi:hypothetical protein
MGNIIYTLSILFSILFCTNASKAQFSTTGFDSFPVSKLISRELTYQFDQPMIKIVEVKFGWPNAVAETNKFLLPAYIQNFDPSFFWEVSFYGKLDQQWDLNPGDFPELGINYAKSLSKKNKGVISLSLDSKETFFLYTEPESETIFIELLRTSNSGPESQRPLLGYKKYDPCLRDVGLTGTLSGQTFLILYSGGQRRAWIFLDKQLVAMFQADNDYMSSSYPPLSTFKIKPYLLLRQGYSRLEQADYIRLSMLARAAAEFVRMKALL